MKLKQKFGAHDYTFSGFDTCTKQQSTGQV